MEVDSDPAGAGRAGIGGGIFYSPAVLERTDLQQWEGTSGGGDFMD